MDCSKTINFFPELKRFCNSRDVCVADAANKNRCPMYDFCYLPNSKVCVEELIKVVENLQKWSDEHPKKTYAQDFFEKFPKAQSGSDGTPFVCREEIYGRARPKFEDCGYMGTCENCWNEPMEE